MKLTENNKIGYLNVIISFAIIISFYAMPCIDFYTEREMDHQICGIYQIIDWLNLGAKEGYYIGRLVELFFTIVIFIQLVNIFIQAKKIKIVNIILPIISGVILFCTFLGFVFVTKFATKKIEIDNSNFEVDYLLGFYIATIATIAQIIVPIFAAIFSKNKSHETAKYLQAPDIAVNTVKPQNENAVLENELRQLKTVVAQIEQEKMRKRREIEIAEKEKAKKEALMNEIAKLKEFIKNHENNPEGL